MYAKRTLALFFAATLLVSTAGRGYAQSGPSEVRIFGFFQSQFTHQNGPERDGVLNSFSLQQLNLFFQKDLGVGLTSFVNFEAVNSFSTRDGWGSLRIEEAWVRYRRSNALSIKAGLQIPTFNNFNEIKNRMPLIPYVIRPLVYESSLASQLNNPLYVPQQSFLQVFGWAPLGSWKFDYAAYLGNTDMIVASNLETSPESNRDVDLATGIDSSSAMLVGSRIGLRKGSFRLGFSATADKTGMFAGAAELPNAPPGDYGQIPRYRSGFDVSFRIGRFWFENESIGVLVDADEGLEAQVGFTYLTIGYELSGQTQAYLGYQIINQRVDVFGEKEEVDLWLPTAGIAYTLEDQITLKGQYAYVVIDIHDNPPDNPDPKFHYLTAAISVSF